MRKHCITCFHMCRGERTHQQVRSQSVDYIYGNFRFRWDELVYYGVEGLFVLFRVDGKQHDITFSWLMMCDTNSTQQHANWQSSSDCSVVMVLWGEIGTYATNVFISLSDCRVIWEARDMLNSEYIYMCMKSLWSLTKYRTAAFGVVYAYFV